MANSTFGFHNISSSKIFSFGRNQIYKCGIFMQKQNENNQKMGKCNRRRKPTYGFLKFWDFEGDPDEISRYINARNQRFGKGKKNMKGVGIEGVKMPWICKERVKALSQRPLFLSLKILVFFLLPSLLFLCLSLNSK